MPSQVYAPVLQTPRLTLILFNARDPTDHDNYLAMINDPKIIAVMGDLKLRTHGQNARLFRSTLIHPDRLPHHSTPGRDDWAFWFVYLNPDTTTIGASPSPATLPEPAETAGRGPLAGCITIGQRSADIPPDVGWAILPSYWNQGYATEAGRAVLRYAMEVLGSKDLVAFPLETNAASIRTARKLGFVDGGKIGDQDGRPHLIFVRPEMEWMPTEGMMMNLMGSWKEEEELCPCSRCEGGKGR